MNRSLIDPLSLTACRLPVLLLLLLATLSPLLVVAATGEGEEQPQRYTCPMHPHYIASDPGPCPICGMDLVPMDVDATASNSDADGEGRAVVTIQPETIQNMGVRYGKVESTRFGRKIRAWGVISENERSRVEVSGRVDGWIERLSVAAVGDPVVRGQLLYELFSPELVAAQRDYLSALERDSGERLRSAAERLRSLGVAEQQVKQLAAARKPFERLPIHAGAAGKVSELSVREGAWLRSGSRVLVIQDYSTVWLNAAVAEKDLPLIGIGTPALVALPNLPGKQIVSRVDYIYPTIDPASRTGRVRLQLENRDGSLRPGAWADVVFEVEARDRLAVPTSALLLDGRGEHLVVALGEGRFEPRLVRSGLTSAGYSEILSGVEEGERIVLSGQFLIDSESSLRESFRKLERLKAGLADLTLGPGQLAMIDHLVDAALYQHEALIDGYDIDSAQLNAAREIRATLWRQWGESRLGEILDRADRAIEEAQHAVTESTRLAALDRLVSALEPWLIEGRPAHYLQQGISIYRHLDGARERWIGQGGEGISPYRRGPFERLGPPKSDWPLTEGGE